MLGDVLWDAVDDFNKNDSRGNERMFDRVAREFDFVTERVPPAGPTWSSLYNLVHDSGSKGVKRGYDDLVGACKEFEKNCFGNDSLSKRELEEYVESILRAFEHLHLCVVKWYPRGGGKWER